MSLNVLKWRGGLAPWQERRVKEMLLGDLRVEPSLGDLAAACGLSTRHFTRAFKSITGAAPHRWLLRKKVERAKDLLWKSNEGIASIAVLCGFADKAILPACSAIMSVLLLRSGGGKRARDLFVH